MRNEINLLGAHWASQSAGGSRLGKGYAECSALYRNGASNSNNCVHTDIGIDNGDEWEVTCMVRQEGSCALIGGYYDYWHTDFSIWADASNNQVQFNFGNARTAGYQVVTTDYDVTQWHTYRMSLSSKEAWIDGNLVGSVAKIINDRTDVDPVLFGNYRTHMNSFDGKNGVYVFKEAKIFRNGELVRHYVPWYRLQDTSSGIAESCGLCDLCNNTYSSMGTNGVEPLFSCEAECVVEVPAEGEFGVSVGCCTTECEIDWGDGTVETKAPDSNVEYSHAYATAGTRVFRLSAPYAMKKVQLGSGDRAACIRRLSRLDCNIVPDSLCDSAVNMTIDGRLMEGKEFIMNYAFRNCESLELTELWDGTYAICNQAFRNCHMLALSKLPRSLSVLGSIVFQSTSLCISSIPYGIMYIRNNCFEHCAAMTVSAIPPSVVYIGAYSFRSCTGIGSFSLPDTVTTIGAYAFYSCSDMTLDRLPSFLTSLGNSAFEGCSMLAVSSLPSTLSGSIGSNAFKNCTGLTSITFNSVLDVNATAFSGCSNLLDIYVPWNEGDVANAPWGAVNATVHYLGQSSSSEAESSSSEGQESSSSDGESSSSEAESSSSGTESSSSSEETPSSSSSSHIYTKSILPAGYVEADAFFCEAQTGNKPYLDIGLVNDATDVWEVEYQHVGTYNGNVPILGGGYAKSNSNFAIWVNNTSNQVEFIFGDGNSASYKVVVTIADVTAWHTYKMDLGTGDAWIDGTLVGRAKLVSANPNPRKCVLFGCWRGSSNFNTGHGAIRSAKITRNGTLVRNYVGALRLSDMKNGMYDLCGSTDGDGGTPFYVTSRTGYGSATFELDATYEVTLDADNTSYTVGLMQVVPNSIEVTWAEGEMSTSGTVSAISLLSHTYSAGIHTVSIHGTNVPYSGLCTTYYSEDSANPSRVTRFVSYSCKVIHPSLCLSASNMVVADGAFDGVFVVGSSAFMECTMLDMPALYDGIKHIDAYAFSQCQNVSFTEMPVELNKLCLGAFSDCPSLTSLVFCGNSVSSISSTAFSNCTNLASIAVPWAEGAVADAPWGATNATITYNNAV